MSAGGLAAGVQRVLAILQHTACSDSFLQADAIATQECDKVTSCELLDILVLPVHPQQRQKGTFVHIFPGRELHLQIKSVLSHESMR